MKWPSGVRQRPDKSCLPDIGLHFPASVLHFLPPPPPEERSSDVGEVGDGLWTEARGQQKQSNDPGNNQHNPQYANYWALLTRKRRILPHPAQPRRTNDWAPRTRKRHQREHRPQRPTERSDPTQHAKGRTGDRPGPLKGATTRRNVTRGGGRPLARPPPPLPPSGRTFFRGNR